MINSLKIFYFSIFHNIDITKNQSHSGCKKSLPIKKIYIRQYFGGYYAVAE